MLLILPQSEQEEKSIKVFSGRFLCIIAGSVGISLHIFAGITRHFQADAEPAHVCSPDWHHTKSFCICKSIIEMVFLKDQYNQLQNVKRCLPEEESFNLSVSQTIDWPQMDIEHIVLMIKVSGVTCCIHITLCNRG